MSNSFSHQSQLRQPPTSGGSELNPVHLHTTTQRSTSSVYLVLCSLFVKAVFIPTIIYWKLFHFLPPYLSSFKSLDYQDSQTHLCTSYATIVIVLGGGRLVHRLRSKDPYYPAALLLDLTVLWMIFQRNWEMNPFAGAHIIQVTIDIIFYVGMGYVLEDKLVREDGYRRDEFYLGGASFFGWMANSSLIRGAFTRGMRAAGYLGKLSSGAWLLLFYLSHSASSAWGAVLRTTQSSLRALFRLMNA